jgi:hypothetical protein
MKKSRQKTNHHRRSLQPQDLAAVRGGDNGTIHVNVGGGPNTAAVGASTTDADGPVG